MSRIFMDGFESGDLNLWSSFYGTPAANTLSGKTGNYCLYAPTGIGYLTLNLSVSKSYIYVAFKFYHTVTTGAYNWGSFIAFYSGGTRLGGLMFKATPTVSATYTTDTNIVNSSISPEPANVWCQYEIYYLPHVSNGSFVVKRNGVTVINATGVQTAPSTTNLDRILLGMSNSGVGAVYFDDFILDDVGWIGSTSIQGLAVTGAGNSAQFDPSTGSNYACVDEIPPSDADYISTNVANEIDTYACGDLTGTINSVKAVQVQARCMQEGSPAVPKIQLVTRPTSTDRVSVSKSVQTFAPGVVSNIWELNPDDSAAWESADVNGMEIGVKAVAS